MRITSIFPRYQHYLDTKALFFSIWLSFHLTFSMVQSMIHQLFFRWLLYMGWFRISKLPSNLSSLYSFLDLLLNSSFSSSRFSLRKALFASNLVTTSSSSSISWSLLFLSSLYIVNKSILSLSKRAIDELGQNDSLFWWYNLT